jgi:hypothetical protein
MAAIAILAGVSAAAAQTTSAATAQEAVDPEPLFAVGSSELMITAGPAIGVVVFHSSRDHKYLLSSFSWGRVLSEPIGPGLLRGRFEWAIELVPLFSQYSPDTTFGAGVTPLTWRWNFDPRGKIVPFAELAGGLLWTGDAVPPGTTSGNFTAHASYGLRYFHRPRKAIIVAYSFHHISNGNRLEKNPGVNAHVVQVGFSVMRPR